MTDAQARLTVALADRYRIERELGQGGMATVYLAHDLKHDRQVAIKVLRPELSASLGSDRFLQEIRIAAKLQHPHIMPLFDSGVVHPRHPERSEGSLLFYVMPYVDGETLRVRLARTGPLPLGEAIRLTDEIADALAKAHKAGVVHRDIKPENIFLSDGHAQVLDFGVAKALSEGTDQHGLTTAGVSLGTPAYMSPEQVAADPHLDHRADIYALGLVAYEMLTGGSPYSVTTPAQQMAAHISQPPAPIRQKRADCPPALDALVMRCLAKNPHERWQTADEILAQLRAADTSTPGPASAGNGRRIALLCGAAAAVIAAAFAVRRMTGPDAGAPASGEHSVGVMAFDNLTHDTAYAYLSEGLSSEIATSLARIPRIEVRSPGWVRSAQRGIEPDPREVGRRLHVRNVVEGEFQQGGDRIRIAARLVAVPSGTQRWSESWTRPITDLLTVQEEIAHAVAKAIAGQLLPEEQAFLSVRPTDNPRAYDHFLRGNFYLAQRSPVGVTRAIEQFHQALRLDSAFAQAQARIALAYGLFAGWGWDFPGVSRDSQIALGFGAADRALALDSAVADGWMARGELLLMRYPRTAEGAEAALQRATTLDSGNAEAWHQFGSMLQYVGRCDESLVPLQRALALEPGRAVTWATIADCHVTRRRDRDALAAYDSALASSPDYFPAYAGRTWIRLRVGDKAGARADAETAMRMSPAGAEYFGLAPRAAVAAADGDTALSRRLMDQALVPLAGPGAPPHPSEAPGYLLVSGLAASGQRKLALDWLERIEPRGGLLWYVMQTPQMDPIRDDPRFKRVEVEARPPGVK